MGTDVVLVAECRSRTDLRQVMSLVEILTSHPQCVETPPNRLSLLSACRHPGNRPSNVHVNVNPSNPTLTVKAVKRLPSYEFDYQLSDEESNRKAQKELNHALPFSIFLLVESGSISMTLAI